jgi:catalase
MNRALSTCFATAVMTLTLAGPALAQTAAAPVDPTAFVNQFEATFGKFEGYRRSGAKGICAEGRFVGSPAARALSTASVFSGEPVPVVVRFSVGGANPQAPDNARSQRNLALQFKLPGGEQWLMGNISAPVFGASSPQQFLGLIASRQPDPVTKMPDPAKVKAFNEANPEVLLLPAHLAAQPVPASFASVNYWGVHGYGFVNAAGVTRYGKWIFEPVSGVEGLSDEAAQAKGPQFLFDELRQRVKGGEVAFDFNLELAEPGDRIDSATTPLPAGREKVTLGRLAITTVSEDAGGACLTVTFNPLIMPKGVVASDDPMLAARAAPYAVSLSRRLTEGAKQQ